MSKALGRITGGATGNFPGDHGTKVTSSAFISIIGGTTIAGTLQKKLRGGGWADVPNLRAVISAADEFLIHGGGIYRFNITASTGNWEYAIRPETP